MSLIETLNKNKLRIITGVIVGVLALASVIAGGIPLMVLAILFTFLCTKEFVNILNIKGFYPFKSIILSINTIFVLVATFQKLELMAFVITLGTIAAFLAVLFRGRQPYTGNVAATITGFVYCGWLPCHIIMIRQLGADSTGLLSISDNPGLGYLLLLFFTILATDIGAYYFGSKFGKHLLCPVVSPKKTVEGAVGGGLVAIAVAMVIGLLVKMPWHYALVAGFLITLFAQLGDLSESLIKRDGGVKDSGNSLPGHGGFLDRIDSYLFSAPVAYYFLNYVVISHSLWHDIQHLIEKAIAVVGL